MKKSVMVRPAAASLALLAGLAVQAQADIVLYNQPNAGLSTAYSSQNDIGGFGNFATTCDNFSLAAGSSITKVEWIGAY